MNFQLLLQHIQKFKFIANFILFEVWEKLLLLIQNIQYQF